MISTRHLALAGAIVALAALTSSPLAQGNRWLVDAPDERTRFERLETYLRGFDQPMWEVGMRYEHVEQAIADRNWALASYHWDKVKTTIDNGLMKRPARRASAEKLFLGAPWEQLSAALKNADVAAIGTAFDRAKAACQACHVAEKLAYMNDQPMFRRSAPRR
jgi:mono/diheme cytochrome c family protein